MLSKKYLDDLTYKIIAEKSKGVMIDFNCIDIYGGQKTLVNEYYAALPAYTYVLLCAYVVKKNTTQRRHAQRQKEEISVLSNEFFSLENPLFHK